MARVKEYFTVNLFCWEICCFLSEQGAYNWTLEYHHAIWSPRRRIGSARSWYRAAVGTNR